MKVIKIELIELPSRNAGTWMNVERVSGPLSSYREFADSRSKWMKLDNQVICVLYTDEGIIGTGITTGGQSVVSVIKEQLSLFVLSQDPLQRSRIYDQMYRGTVPYGHGKITMSGISCVDIGLWNITAKKMGTPMYNLMGGKIKDEVQIYATIGKVEHIANAHFAGYKALAPYGPYDGKAGMDGNLSLIHDIRKKVGPDKYIAMDCFCSWDIEYTLEMMKRLRNENVAWVEDPLEPNDTEGYSAIKNAIPRVNLAQGNFIFDPKEFYNKVKLGIIDILQPDIRWAGGISGAITLAKLANLAGLAFSPHNGASQPWAIHLLSTFPGKGDAELVVLNEDENGVPKHIYGAPSSSPVLSDISTDLNSSKLEALRSVGKTTVVV